MFVLVSSESGRSLAEVKEVENLNQLHAEFRQVEDSPAEAALAAAALGTPQAQTTATGTTGSRPCCATRDATTGWMSAGPGFAPTSSGPDRGGTARG
jgi:hypothetical protein